MKLYTLFYYDSPFLEAFLNHYCHIPCIDEIIIQNQNWSQEATLYLLKTAAKYIDDYDVKISILPSQYQRTDSFTTAKKRKIVTKRAQLHRYGQPTIRNRVVQFLMNETFITGAPDAVIYGKSYLDTHQKLVEFEELAKERAKEGQHTAGFVRVYTPHRQGEFHSGFNPTVHSVHWKNRVNHFVTPFKYTGAPVHDFQISVLEEGRWHRFSPRSGHYLQSDFKRLGTEVQLDLKVLHYQHLFRPNSETTELLSVERKQIQNLDEHPEHYIEKMLK